ncbi:MAG: hypothetical protein LBS69_05880 [Prevotellaceae bacterium]|jgi:flagellar biosynthesis GTPase FlhF|nr:hypothetical protein [Prevotellaceae bacterium]
MIQEQISTSSPRCLDGNAGFGVVAQTSGMAPNISLDVGMLSGYTHCFSPGDPHNPVAFLHVIRRAGGVDRHIVSRIADCGSDYSGRSNRIAHHLIIENSDLQQLTCGPAAILTQAELFKTQWNSQSQELPRGKTIPNPAISVQKCLTWERLLGDAGWGGVVAERIERGNPVSVIFEAGKGKDILPLLCEVFMLLPPAIRWRTTFSTFFMKSQEPPKANKIQLKCIVADSDEMMFKKLTADTFVVDLREKPKESPVGKYVEIARNGFIQTQTKVQIPINVGVAEGSKKDALLEVAVPNDDKIYEMNQPINVPSQQPVQLRPLPINYPANKKPTAGNSFWIRAVIILVLLSLTVVIGTSAVLYNNAQIAKSEKEQRAKEAAVAEAAKQKEKEEKAKEEAAKQKKKEEEEAAKQKAEQERKEKEKEEAAKQQAEEKRKEKEREEAAKQKKKEEEEAAKRKEKEARERNEKLKGQFAKLPDVWEGICLPLPGGWSWDLLKLKGSEFLFEHKDKVKITYIPFVKLDLGDEKLPAINIVTDEKNKNIIKFQEKTEPDMSGNPQIRDIATIKLDKGLEFTWHDKTGLVDDMGTDHPKIRRLNRIMLAKLKVEIEGISEPKEIALFDPVKVDKIDTKKFKLWGDRKKEYFTHVNDKAPFYIDVKTFSKIGKGDEQVPSVDPKKIVSLYGNCAGFIPEISYKGKSGTCWINVVNAQTVVNAQALELELKFLSSNQKEPQDECNKLIAASNRNKANIQKAEKEKKGITDAHNQQMRMQHNDYLFRKAQIYDAYQQGKMPNNIFKEVMEAQDKTFNGTREAQGKIFREKMETQDKIIKENTDEIAKRQQKIANLKKKIDENKGWNQIKLEKFSLYLLKTETGKDGVNKPENQLLLLEVDPQSDKKQNTEQPKTNPLLN